MSTSVRSAQFQFTDKRLFFRLPPWPLLSITMIPLRPRHRRTMLKACIPLSPLRRRDEAIHRFRLATHLLGLYERLRYKRLKCMVLIFMDHHPKATSVSSTVMEPGNNLRHPASQTAQSLYFESHLNTAIQVTSRPSVIEHPSTHRTKTPKLLLELDIVAVVLLPRMPLQVLRLHPSALDRTRDLQMKRVRKATLIMSYFPPLAISRRHISALTV